MTKPKILCWDLETSYMAMAGFSLWEEIKSHNNILEDWYIICGAYKWLGEKKVHAVAIEKAGDDKDVVQHMRDVIAEADIVIHHNGDAFDLKKLAARMIVHGIEPFPMPACIDTLKVAKKEFKFTSNRLDYLGKALGVGGKIENPPGMWLDVLKGDLTVIPKMIKYNKRDVTLLEEVYVKLRPYIRNHPNLNLYSDSDTATCPNCGNHNLQNRGYARTRKGKYQRKQCQDCGAWCQESKSLQTVEVA